MKSIRVLNVLGGVFRFGGTEAVIMNYYRHVDRSKVQFDFVVHGFEKGVYDDEIAKLGGKIYNIPIKSVDYLGNVKALKTIFNTGEYKIVHSHMDAMSMVVLKIAKKCGVPVRIAHSHNTSHQTTNKLQFALHEHARKNITKYATHLFACSEFAGKWLFGEDVVNKDNFCVVKNAIDFERFCFNDENRAQIRTELNIQDNFVIGHIGRFSEQKNHMFLLDIFHELLKLKPGAKLLLVGDGHLKTQIEERIRELNISSNVLLLGLRSDTHDIINAFDVFLLPSLFEGLPVVLTETQANGLQCFVSDSITKEVDLLGNMTYLPLDDPPAKWAEIISESYGNKANQSRTIPKETFAKTGYEINTAAKDLQEFYLDVLKEQKI